MDRSCLDNNYLDSRYSRYNDSDKVATVVAGRAGDVHSVVYSDARKMETKKLNFENFIRNEYKILNHTFKL